MYHKARKDFDATAAKTLERTKSAKFLRDTTENCLTYIAAKQNRPRNPKVEVTSDGKMLDELRSTLEETMTIAEQGSGGKKRRFDENWESVPQEPARMRGPCLGQLGSSDPTPRGRTSEIKRRPIISRIQELQVSPRSAYRQHNMDLAERRRSERRPLTGRVHGDRYRPAYRRSWQET